MALRSFKIRSAKIRSAKIPNQLPTDNAFGLVCQLAGAQLSSERVEGIANSSLVAPKFTFSNLPAIDWDELLSLAEDHGVLPLVARNLMEQASRPAPEIERRLRSAYETNLRRNLWFTAELTRILDHFERHKIRVIPYKGPVLAQALYRDLGMRSFSDLDFLISPTDFDSAKRALAEIGYRPATDFSAALEKISMRTGYERSFDGAAGGNLVELQWALTPYFYALDLRVDDLLARSGTATIGERNVPCLSPEDSLLVLCLHAAKHLWTRLIWLADIAATLRTQTIDFALALSRANSLGVARILGVSFSLVKNVLGGEIPKSAEEFITADPEVPLQGRLFADRLASGVSYDFESTEYFRLIQNLRERRRDRWRYMWRLVWTPGPSDFAAVRLPDALFPLYRIVRIGRLIRKAGR